MNIHFFSFPTQVKSIKILFITKKPTKKLIMTQCQNSVQRNITQLSQFNIYRFITPIWDRGKKLYNNK
jgi:hypothetical protein